MPKREETFFRAWKAAAQYDVSLRLSGIERAASKIRALADRPEDALLQSLDGLQVPNQSWQEYLSLHLAALPGWAGFIKWREEQTSRPWQITYRIDLVKYLAVRLFYEQELVESTCRKAIGCAGTVGRSKSMPGNSPIRCGSSEPPFRSACRENLVGSRAPSGSVDAVRCD